jgi:hypothetical protein
MDDTLGYVSVPVAQLRDGSFRLATRDRKRRLREDRWVKVGGVKRVATGLGNLACEPLFEAKLSVVCIISASPQGSTHVASKAVSS